MSIASLVVGLILVVLSNIPVLWPFFRPDDPSAHRTPDYYRDEDGEATTSSLRALGGKWTWRSIAALSLVGLACISAAAIIVTCRRADEVPWLLWCQFAGWMLSSCQAAVVFTEKSASKRFSLANCAFWTSIGLITLVLSDMGLWLSFDDTTVVSLQIASIAIATTRAVCCVLIPRRPDVYHEGKIVDQEHTVSILSRLSFFYVGPFVDYARRHQNTMAAGDFPQLPCRARSEHLHDTVQLVQQQGNGRSLFQALLNAHSQALILQIALGVASGLLSFGPQIALYGILKSLEDHSSGIPGVWAAALGVTMFLASSISSWLWCITYSRLAIPIYSELLALLYAKSMRRKNIQQANSADDDKRELSDSPQERRQQDIINLVTVDTKRISDYASYNHLIPSSLTQLIVACGLLVRLIGWQSLLAGLAANLLLSPLNLYIAKVYRVFQKTLMQARDERTAVVYEVVKNIRQIKFSSSEPAWRDRVLEVRKHEMRLNLQSIFYETGFQGVWTLAPLLLSAISLSVYALQNGGIEASVAFTAISITGSLEVALAALPHLISTALEAKISVDRIDEFMGGPEKPPSPSTTADAIIFHDATVSWPAHEGSEDEVFRLSGLNLKFPPKGLTVVSGRTGCGKTLLLSSILNECDIVSGSIQVPKSGHEIGKCPPNGSDGWIIDSAIAYVAQNPWTENGTIRDNILFGLPLDRLRYQEVLFSSGLERDLDILADGDQTDIGANGINLSGGQRFRVSFARALYSRAGILILDDIFSALDTDTCHHVYKYGLTGDLAQNRTRVLATHNVGLCLPRTDHLVLLAGGSLRFAGSVEELRKMESSNDFLLDDSRRDDDDTQLSQVQRHSIRELRNDKQTDTKFSPEEQRATGSVPLKLHKKFMTADNTLWIWVLGIVAALLYTVLFFGRLWWLNVWTGTSHTDSFHRTMAVGAAMNYAIEQVQMMEVPKDLFMYVGVYVGTSLAAGLMGTLRFFLIRVASLRSSQALFKNILSAVLAAPLRWVDTVPLGRVLNRFTSDIYTLDYLLGSDLADLLLWTFQICGVLVACVSVSPIVLVPAAFLLLVSVKLCAKYLAAAREVKRLESVSRTPILEQFTSSLVGLTTIRAFDETRKYILSLHARIDDYSKVSRNLWLLNWWLQLRINLLGALFSTVVAAMIVKLGLSASFAGFAISFLLQYNAAVSSTIRFYANFEMDMNATERVIDYASIDTEPQGGIDPPAIWPTKGHMTVENLVVSYSPELPPVLKGLTFSIEPNERIGVVGRTGSGKSTLALALFRFMEARQGRVVIDGLDTSKLKLHAFRRALAIVPQHPTLFRGTIRSNLDPFDWYSETQLIDALERVHLVSSNDKSFSLDTAVSEGGENFSHGQRQLLCLARAILQQPKIMVLDEATSAVDMKTDGHIQQAIRSEFGRNMSSLLVIAHRLSTIADFDRILVIDDGRIVEAGPPKNLIGIDGGVFQELISQSGERGLVEMIISGQAGNQA